MTEEVKSLFWYRVKFLGLIGVFLAPFVGGWMALYVFDLKPESGNYGTLVQPVKKLQWPVMTTRDGQVFEGGFGRKWAFILFSNDACEAQCQSNLFYMRQIRTLLGRDVGRLQNVLISGVPMSASMQTFLQEYPDLLVVEEFKNVEYLSRFAVDDKLNVGDKPRLYLVDPDQNYMMYYPAEPDEHLILEDLRKLLKLSKIG